MNMVARGKRTLHLLESSRTPAMPEAVVPKGVVEAGYVRAMTTGRAVCMEKYTGKIFAMRAAN